MSDQNKKLSVANDRELMQLFTELINYSGQKFSSEDEANICYVNFIPLFKNSFGKYSLNEIKLAYQYAREGKFTNERGEQFRLFRELNYASACDVMIEYEEFKKKELGEFVKNQKLFEQVKPETKEEEKNRIERDGLRQFLRESWELCEQGKLNESTGVFLYDNLRMRGLITLSTEEKRDIQENALQMVHTWAEMEKAAAQDKVSYKVFDRILESLSGQTDEVVLASKKIALQCQIQNWIMEGLSIEEVEQMIL